MVENSKIEWCHHTFNPWIGCQKVSPGCDHCYAETLMDTRYGRVKWGPRGKRVRTSLENWRKPIRWAKDARDEQSRPRVFCASLADVFDNKAPKGAREDLFALIKYTPELDWLLLSKRPENMKKMLPADWGTGWPNVWLGTTCEDQQHYDHRWPILQRIPATLRFISYEPALGELWVPNEWPQPDWFICGGESGSRARWMDPNWARSLKNQCAQREIAFFMKQMTKKWPIPADLLVRQYPKPHQAIAA